MKSRCMRIVNLGELVLYMKAFFYIYDSITSEISGNFALGSCRFPPRIGVQKRFKVSNGSRGRITGRFRDVEEMYIYNRRECRGC